MGNRVDMGAGTAGQILDPTLVENPSLSKDGQGWR